MPNYNKHTRKCLWPRNCYWSGTVRMWKRSFVWLFMTSSFCFERREQSSEHRRDTRVPGQFCRQELLRFFQNQETTKYQHFCNFFTICFILLKSNGDEKQAIKFPFQYRNKFGINNVANINYLLSFYSIKVHDTRHFSKSSFVSLWLFQAFSFMSQKKW